MSTFIKALVLQTTEGEDVNFRAGGAVDRSAPQAGLQGFRRRLPEYREDWDKFNLWRYESVVEPVERAYSMANYPEEKGIIYHERARGLAAARFGRHPAGQDVVLYFQPQAGRQGD